MGSVQLFNEKIGKTETKPILGADGSLVPLMMFCRLVTVSNMRSYWTQPAF